MLGQVFPVGSVQPSGWHPLLTDQQAVIASTQAGWQTVELWGFRVDGHFIILKYVRHDLVIYGHYDSAVFSH
jgi:hypothetical protein